MRYDVIKLSFLTSLMYYCYGEVGDICLVFSDVKLEYYYCHGTCTRLSLSCEFGLLFSLLCVLILFLLSFSPILYSLEGDVERDKRRKERGTDTLVDTTIEFAYFWNKVSQVGRKS